jgi:DNA repair protein RadC
VVPEAPEIPETPEITEITEILEAATPGGAAASRDLRNRLRAGGPQALDDAEALQLVSGASAAAVQRLLAEFGSLPQVLAAAPAALGRRLSPACAARLILAYDVARRLLQSPLRRRPQLRAATAVADYLRAQLAGRARAQLRALYLDGGGRLIRDEVLAEGCLDQVPLYPREILRRALELDAAGVILGQNHPGGGGPTAAEARASRQLAEAGRWLGVQFHDHLLVADQAVVSFRALGLL